MTWKQWHDQILEVVESKYEDDDSINKLEVMLNSFQFHLHKESYISFVYVLHRSLPFEDSKNGRSKQLIYDKLVEVTNQDLFSQQEIEEVSNDLKYIKNYCMNNI